MNKTLRYILYFALIIITISGCSGGCSSGSQDNEDSFVTDNEPLAMVIKQRSDSNSVDISENLSKAFEYAKIPYQSLDLGLLSGSFEIPESVNVLTISTSESESFTDEQVEIIVQFVANGNTLFIAQPMYDDRFNFLTGVRKDAEYTIAQRAEGFRFNETVFPGYSDAAFKLKAPYFHDGLTAEAFEDDVEIIAHSYDSSRAPVLTRNRIAGGEVIMLNSGTGFEKLYRGLLFSINLSGLENIPYPVANASAIFLDDFPLPLYDKKSPPIDWEYDVTEEEFITKIWWPDMLAMADTFDIDYTAVQAFNYNANVVPPFDFNEWELSSIEIDNSKVNGSIWLAQEVRDSRHELGFHGYNHFSLLDEEWPNQEFMVGALKAARKRWSIDNLGPLPVTYVPPTNNIDSLGIDALRRGMPQIRNMSSLYLDDIETGGGREFGTDPYSAELFDYPRISSGFIVDERNRFAIQGLYILSGIWSHFVHPDDVFQVKQRDEDAFSSRNELGLGWHKSKEYNYGLYEVFFEFLTEMKQTYPLINYETVNEAVNDVKEWNALQIQREPQDSMIAASRRPQKDALTTWFAYVNTADRDTVEKHIARQAEEYHFTPYWDGYLLQFTSSRDSITLPQPSRRDEILEGPEAIRNQYLAFLDDIDEGPSNDASGSEVWEDTRLEDARAALRQNPSSRRLQERVINLSVEFGRVPLAIEILENRLLSEKEWYSEDIDRLLTYYGWEGASDRAYGFLEKLWENYGDDSIITLKEMMTDRYGVPDQAFENKWLNRELALKPGNEQVLEQLVLNNQGEEYWPEAKEYINQMIEQNPQSDSLYFYKLQRSFYYDEPQEILTMIESFPDRADPQLEPLATEIANLYAYTAENYGKALQWADRAANFPDQPKLEWLLQQKRYKAFIDRGDEALNRTPDNDSLRVFVGQQLIYEGFYEEGYQRLYPLFERERAPATTQDLVHTEIGYQPYNQKKAFYKKYPAFFSDSLEKELQQQYRIQEGTKVGVTANYASDNFDNTIGRIGSFIEWGNRQKRIHKVTAEETFVGSTADSIDAVNYLSHIDYQFRRLWPDDGFQLTVGAGFYYEDRLRPDAEVGLGYGKDSTYTSLQLTLQPVFTNTSINRDINELAATLYREDYWLNSTLQTTLSLIGKRYSNDVYSLESLGRLYWQLPFSTSAHRVRGVGELAYSDASTSYTSGIPYYTPDQLLVEGGGLQYRYRDAVQNPDLLLELELLGKHGSQDGFFITSSARLNARIQKYWELSLDANISSSSLYRYNQVGFTISYLFPNEL